MTPEQIQQEAVSYFRTLKMPDHVVPEVWSIDEDSGEKCLDPRCSRVGYVFVALQCYCLGHASMVLLGMSDGPRLHTAIDVARPILAPVVHRQSKSELLERTLDYLRYVSDRKGSTVTVDMAVRARGLVQLWSKANES